MSSRKSWILVLIKTMFRVNPHFTREYRFLISNNFNRLSSTIFFYVWTVSHIFLRLRFDDMKLSISYVFYMQDILKDYSNVLNVLNLHYFFICKLF